MKMRAPAVPLITVDPYLSVWSMGNALNESTTCHWTGHKLPLNGNIYVDEKKYFFMGECEDGEKLEQVSLDISSMITTYNFSCNEIDLTVEFMSPLLLDNLDIASRPVSYISISAKPVDNKVHNIRTEIIVDDSICQNYKYEYPTVYEKIDIDGIACAKVGSKIQHVLGRSGDDVRIDWGYVYAATNSKSSTVEGIEHKHEYGTSANEIKITAEGENILFVIAYDDIKSIEYFGEHLSSYWNKDGKTIETAIQEAFADYETLKEKAKAFDNALKKDARDEKYYELLALAYRQAVAAHKIAVDKDGKILFISKECFSNGCAATVDVTYPSIPLFLLYNPELVKGMLRPIFKYAETDEWFYDFAPHDAGTYPLLNGQVYSHGTTPYWQMPVEECGNMLVATTAVAVAENNIDFAKENWALLKKWCDYLLKNGLDPENQLCTDDFAGHLAHNCNLSLKAIMGIASFAVLNKMDGKREEYNKYISIAKDMAEKWIKTADDGNGQFRLAFDRPKTYSMKYNAVWDTLFETGIFPKNTFKDEITEHINSHTNKYGLVLDNRAKYTKSDWLLWTAAMTDDDAQFNSMIERLWNAYNESESRVPMTDWYDTETGKKVGFQNRTVQGGLFIRILKDKGICKIK